MSSLVYFVQVTGGGPIKIGYTEGDPRSRMVKIQCDCPWPVALIGAVAGDFEEEQAFHAKLKDFRIQGEWFHPHNAVIAAIETAVATMPNWVAPPVKHRPRNDHPLCHYRADNDLTLQDIAQKVGVSHSALSRVECGKSFPSPHLARRIHDITGIPMLELVHPVLRKIFGPEAAQ